MKRYRNVALCTIVVISVLMVALAVATPPLVKRYIVQNSQSLIGRKVEIERLRMNIFTGRLRTENLIIYEADGTTQFATLDYFDMRLRLMPLLWHRCIINHITLRHPDIAIHQNGNDFNIDDLVSLLRRDKSPSREGRKWDIGIYNILIDGGRFLYTDRMIDAQWRTNDLNLSIPGLYFSGKSTDVGVVLNFAGGGRLATEIKYNVESSDYILHLKIDDMVLHHTLPYLRRIAEVSKVDGRMSMDIDVSGNTSHLLAFSTSGNVSVAEFALHNNDKEPVMSIDSVYVAINDCNFTQRRYDLQTLYTSGIKANIRIDKEGRGNISAMLANAPASERRAIKQMEFPTDSVAIPQEPEPMPLLHIGRIDLRDGEINFTDESLHTPFTYTVSSIVVRGQEFDLASDNRIMVNAQMQQQGSAMIRWDGAMHSMDNHDILISLSNITLKELSPYIEHLTGYPIIGGNMTIRSQNIISNGYLRGTNHLDIYRPTTDKRIAGLNPEMNIPLKLGFYVMTDNRGHVNIDLPVKGNIDSPEFSYRKIVMKALGNLLLKVVSSPLTLLFGDGEHVEHINIDALQHAFTSEQYSRLDKLAQMVEQRPEIRFVLTQRINSHKAIERNAAIMLKMAYYNSLQDDSLRKMSMLDFESAIALQLRSEDIGNFADSLLIASGCDSIPSTNRQKAMALYGGEAEQHINQLRTIRDYAVAEYLRNSHPSLPEGAIRIEQQADSLAKPYHGSDRYTIQLVVDGESIELGGMEEAQGVGHTEEQTDAATQDIIPTEGQIEVESGQE